MSDELLAERKKIDEIDSTLANLFEQRMTAAEKIAKIKQQIGKSILDSSREQEILERELQYISNPEFQPYYAELITFLMSLSKRYQLHVTSGIRIAYCGIEGAFANMAAKKIFPNGKLVAYSSFEEAYNAVKTGSCEYAVLPVENSFAGEVSQVFDLMLHGDLYIHDMKSFRISQNLLGTLDSEISDITTVYSHQQALDQCNEFIRQNGFVTVPYSNTAVAAKEISLKNDKTIAAIASEEAANLYNLKILKRNINQNSQNSTRFAVFSAMENKVINTDYDYYSLLMFTVKNKPGALAKAIKAIGKTGFNLVTLHSHPIKNVPWEYFFYAEVEGSLYSAKGKELVRKLGRECSQVKVLGHFYKDSIETQN